MRPEKTRIDQQRGSVCVELALLLTFLFIPLLIGIVDFGQLLHAQNIMTRAAREGAMAASRSQDVDGAVLQYVQNAGYDVSRTQIDTQGSRASSEPVTVTITYDTSAMVIIPWGNFTQNMTRVVSSATTQQLY
ncbi:TadE/TadG family type IV pilus assembly protein [Desulfolutivibrio sulfoxidireducens]|uniref:TadE/TadG family type IV pilus assembly protein n=1 Tax=Desulfolutivibrio sulfoxidireducens TaxID=2773299 RepID=UPI001FEBB989|nr:TadE family protein [Desulfolutivibrio sulfoxidireducens]